MVHSGGCHCGRVRWRAEAPASVVVWICNCSDCAMRGNAHFVVPASKFTLAAGAGESLTTTPSAPTRRSTRSAGSAASPPSTPRGPTPTASPSPPPASTRAPWRTSSTGTPTGGTGRSGSPGATSPTSPSPRRRRRRRRVRPSCSGGDGRWVSSSPPLSVVL